MIVWLFLLVVAVTVALLFKRHKKIKKVPTKKPDWLDEGEEGDEPESPEKKWKWPRGLPKIGGNLVLSLFFCSPLIFLFFLVAGICFFYPQWWTIVLGVILVPVWGWFLFSQYRTEVPEGRVYILTLFKRHFLVLKPGLWLICPWWDIFNIPWNIYMLDQTELFIFEDPASDDTKEEKQIKSGKLELADGLSATFRVEVFWKVVEPEKFAYHPNATLKMRSKIESHLKAELSKLRIDPTVTNATALTASTTATITIPDFSADEEILAMGIVISRKAYVRDVGIPKEVQESRKKVFDAEQDEKAALHEKKATITKAEGAAQALKLEGEGWGRRIEELAQKANISPEDAAEFLKHVVEWESIKESGNPVIIKGEGGSSGGMDAAKFAAIIERMRKEVKNEAE